MAKKIVDYKYTIQRRGMKMELIFIIEACDTKNYICNDILFSYKYDNIKNIEIVVIVEKF